MVFGGLLALVVVVFFELVPFDDNEAMFFANLGNALTELSTLRLKRTDLLADCGEVALTMLIFEFPFSASVFGIFPVGALGIDLTLEVLNLVVQFVALNFNPFEGLLDLSDLSDLLLILLGDLEPLALALLVSVAAFTEVLFEGSFLVEPIVSLLFK